MLVLLCSPGRGKGQTLKDEFHVPFLPKAPVNRVPECSESTLFHNMAKADLCLSAALRLHQGVCLYWSDISIHFKLREMSSRQP